MTVNSEGKNGDIDRVRWHMCESRMIRGSICVGATILKASVKIDLLIYQYSNRHHTAKNLTISVLRGSNKHTQNRN